MPLSAVAYLASFFLSLLGNAVAAVALPLIVLQTTGSALGAGVVAASTAIPAVLAGLFMGVVIDRINRRTSSVATDLVSAAAVAALPVVDAVSGLTIGWFVLLGVIGSLGDVPGMTAREALLPAVVRHSGVAADRLVGLREALGAVALLVGPAMAGTLMTVLEGATVLWITAATSLLAAALTLLVPRSAGEIVPDDDPPHPTAGGTRSVRRELRDGLRALTGSAFLVAVTVLGAAAVLVLTGFQALVLPVYFTFADRGHLLGFVLSALAIGVLVGGTVYAIVGSRLPRTGLLAAALGGTTLGFALLATLAAPWVVFLGAFTVGAASGLLNGLLAVLLIERIPETLRGRVLGAQNAAVTVAPPVGILVAAVVTEYVGVGAAALLLAGIWAVAALATVAARPLRTLGPVRDDGEVRVDA